MANFPSGWELVMVLLVIVVVFGSKRLPDTARSLGRSMRILKAETKGMHDDDATPSTPTMPATQALPSLVAVSPPVTWQAWTTSRSGPRASTGTTNGHVLDGSAAAPTQTSVAQPIEQQRQP